MKIVWLRQANQDLLNAFEWLNKRNPAEANRAVQAIYSQISQLQNYPQLGRTGKIANTRELVIQKTRYVVAYRLNFSQNTIEILALVHESQQWPDEF